MDSLDALENQSIYIFREAYRKFKDLAMLWSIGKDSTTLLWLARKAFFGRVPFPLVHIDTNYKYPQMIEYRDRMAAEWGVEMIIGQNKEALCDGMHPSKGRLICCNALKTQGLQQVLDKHGFKGIFLGIRRDEEGSRAKERVFSPRDKNFEWNYKDQPPELWDQFNTSFGPETHVRIHPLLSWTELDIWEYIANDSIAIPSIYFAHERVVFERDGMLMAESAFIPLLPGERPAPRLVRFRTVGDMTCTAAVESDARTVEQVIAEIAVTRITERGASRADDKFSEAAMEDRKREGYF